MAGGGPASLQYPVRVLEPSSTMKKQAPPSRIDGNSDNRFRRLWPGAEADSQRIVVVIDELRRAREALPKTRQRATSVGRNRGIKLRQKARKRLRRRVHTPSCQANRLVQRFGRAGAVRSRIQGALLFTVRPNAWLGVGPTEVRRERVGERVHTLNASLLLR